MTLNEFTDSTPARAVFPEYWSLENQARAEVAGMSDSQLDWTSPRWRWSEWSVRQNLSHMGSVFYRWMLERWGETLFPDGLPLTPAEIDRMSSASHDRRMDDGAVWEIEDVLKALGGGAELVRQVMLKETVGSMRSRSLIRSATPQWPLMSEAHPTGIDLAPDGNGGSMTLEATFRHMYFEFVTHLYNIQRLKRAKNLTAVVKLPKVGYWVLPGWDRSEP